MKKTYCTPKSHAVTFTPSSVIAASTFGDDTLTISLDNETTDGEGRAKTNTSIWDNEW